MRTIAQKFITCLLAIAVMLGVSIGAHAEPLKIVYSDWPGWVAWEIPIQKGWFKEAGVEVEFTWFDYVPGMEAFAAGQMDAVSMTNGDALVIGATSNKPSVAIIINDYSNGNDMIIAKPGINSLKDLVGKRIGIEVGFVDHLLLLHGLKEIGLEESDVTLVNVPTNETPQALAAGGVDAIGAWYPSSHAALRAAPGAKSIYTSKEVPGLIYDVLYVSQESLATRRADWMKVVGVWYRTMDWIKKSENKDEALQILAARVQTNPKEYATIFEGTHLLSLDEALEAWKNSDELSSIYGSSKYADAFNVKYEVYPKPEYKESYFDPSLTLEYAKSVGKE